MTVTTGQTGAGTTFSEVLKAASWGAHEQATQTPFMQQLLAGELDRARYADFVAQHYFAYLVLEEAAEAMAADPVASRFLDPALTRVPALRQDLEFLLGPSWADQVAPNEGTTTYCDRMRQVCFDWPGGFVAHHYTRYLGDLSGGQFIRRVVERTYDLTDQEGVRFYVFDDLDAKAFKDRYRDELDRAPWDTDEQHRIVDEILAAYQLNTAVLDGLG